MGNEVKLYRFKVKGWFLSRIFLENNRIPRKNDWEFLMHYVLKPIAT